MHRLSDFTWPCFLLVAAASCGGPPPLRTGSVAVDADTDLFFRAVGHGRDTVVLLHHGPGLHGAYLVDVLRPLGPAFTFIIYDQRGRGRSSRVGDTLQLSLERDVADLEAVRARLGLERLLLVAHGWGAAIASQYVLAHPHRVSRLVLVSPVFPRAEHTWGFLVHPYESADSFGLVGLDSARMDRRETTDPVAFCRRFWGAYLSPTVVRDSFTLARLAPAICDAPPAALSQVEAVHRAIIRPLGSWDWREQLRSVVTPTLILQGQGTGPRDSSNAPVWRTSAREWAAIPNSGIVFLNAPVQFPWLRDEALFARLLGDFLSGGWPAGARAPHDRPSP